MAQLEQIVGKKVVKIAVFDREGLTVWIFQKMTKQGRRFITFLRDNQYESEKDFDIPTGERYRPFRNQRILDANKNLKARDILKQIQCQLGKREKSHHKITQKIEKELKEITSLLRQAPTHTVRPLQKQSNLLRQKDRTTGRWLKKITKLNSTIKEKTTLIRSHEKAINQAQTKLSKLSFDERLYEIDTSKDQFITNLEVALTNADPYFKEHFLPAPYQEYDFATIRDILYAQSGTIRQTSQEIIVSLKAYTQDPEHQKLAKYAVRRFNQAKIYTPANQRLIMRVEKLP